MIDELRKVITPGVKHEGILDLKESQYAIKHVDVSKFSIFANMKMENEVYSPYVFNSKPYKETWDFIDDCMINGMTVDGLSITGYHAFFLNFHPMNIVKDPRSHQSAKIESFGRFWDEHYRFFHHLRKSEQMGRHFGILKPRGTGFSEVMSSIGACDYTLHPRSKSFYFASHQDYLIKDGVLTKVWDNLNFLNLHTEKAYKHLRQVKDRDMHKRASYLTAKKDEKGFRSEIIGRIIDHPRKVRGARTGTKGKVYFEEGGSFPNLKEAVTQTRALVEQGGVTTGQIILWGTGGEQGPGIEGLDYIFYHPDAYNFYWIDNIWDEDRYGQKCCYFFPVQNAMDRYIINGVCDTEAAKQHHLDERARIRQESPEEEDRYVAEYPFTPGEALTRLSANDFPISELKRQLHRVQTDQHIQAFIKDGVMVTDQDGNVDFRPDPDVIPITRYPWTSNRKDGCVTVVETPYRDRRKKVPAGLYQITVDPYYKDTSDSSPSLGAAFVYKHATQDSETEDDILVAWYIGRPASTETFNRNLFLLAEYYNCTIQSEIEGGGKGIYDYAVHNRLLHRCALEPDLMSRNSSGPARSKNYFISMAGGDKKNTALTYFIDWVSKPRALTTDSEGNTVNVLNLHKIYCSFLLESMIKYTDEGNFDAISACLPLMFMLKDRANNVELKLKQENESNFWNRPLFTDRPAYQDSNLLSPDEMGMDDDRLQSEF